MSTDKRGYPRAPRLRVEITQEILDRAQIKHSGFCANAEAVKEAFPGAKNVAVDLQTIRFTDPKRRLRFIYLTPPPAQQVVINNDEGIRSEPIAYNLRGAHIIRMPNAPRRKPGEPKLNFKQPPKNAVLRGKRVKAGRASTSDNPRNRHSMGNIPDRIGGPEPKLGALAHEDGDSNKTGKKYFAEVPYSKRREFGIRALRARPRPSAVE